MMFAAASATRHVHADEAPRSTARLSYSAPDATCPDTASFRDLVAARLGYDPFEERGRFAVAVEITKLQNKLVGRASVAQDNPSTAVRELSGELDRCEPLATALATTVAIALDAIRLRPLADTPPEPVPATIVVVRERDAVHEPPPEAPPAPPPRDPWRPTVFGILGGSASVAVGPAPTFGPEIAISARSKSLSLEAGARLETTAGSTRTSSGDRLEATVITGALTPCAHLAAFQACVFGRVGSLQGRAPDVVQPTLSSSLYASTGLRVGYTLALGPVFALRFAVEGGIPLVRTSLAIDQRPVWTSPVAFGGISIAFVARLL